MSDIAEVYEEFRSAAAEWDRLLEEDRHYSGPTEGIDHHFNEWRAMRGAAKELIRRVSKKAQLPLNEKVWLRGGTESG